MEEKSIFQKYAVVLSVFFMVLNIMGCSNKNMAGVDMKRDYMITDQLSRAEKYYDMHPAFKKAFKYLLETDLSKLPLGRNDIDGDKMFCVVSRGPRRRRNEAKLEAHRKYIDIHYTISGIDEIGWKPTAACREVDTNYNEDNDIEFFKDQPQTWIKVPAGSFAIFFPQDAHAPMVGDSEIHKVVLKILF
jgi:biofilm protein TabA